MPRTPALVESRDAAVPLDSLVRQKCPALAAPDTAVFHPHPLLVGGHLQTMYAAVYQRTIKGGLRFDRELVHMPDGGIVSLDWHKPKGSDDGNAHPKAQNGKVPCVLILHGLTGGSHETYVQDLVAEVAQIGYLSVVMNFRGCSRTPLVTPQLYSGAYTGDVAYCIKHIQTKIKNAVIIGCGFSLGANVITKFTGETGEKCPLIGCVSIGNPFDLLGAMRALHRSWIGKYLYSRVMTQSLVRLFKRHMHAFKDMDIVDIEGVHKAVEIIDFDEACTRRAFNFLSAEDYYRCGSSAQTIPEIAVPTLILSALDDPVASAEVLPWRESLYNPHVILATTDQGGHLGWFHAAWDNMVPRRRWFAKPVGQFITAIMEANLSIPEHEHQIIKAKRTTTVHRRGPKGKPAGTSSATEIKASESKLRNADTQTVAVVVAHVSTSITTASTSEPIPVLKSASNHHQSVAESDTGKLGSNPSKPSITVAPAAESGPHKLPVSPKISRVRLIQEHTIQPIVKAQAETVAEAKPKTKEVESSALTVVAKLQKHLLGSKGLLGRSRFWMLLAVVAWLVGVRKWPAVVQKLLK
eukprot:jgi/Hompol1/1780/HPOL_002757-RA